MPPRPGVAGPDDGEHRFADLVPGRCQGHGARTCELPTPPCRWSPERRPWCRTTSPAGTPTRPAAARRTPSPRVRSAQRTRARRSTRRTTSPLPGGLGWARTDARSTPSMRTPARATGPGRTPDARTSSWAGTSTSRPRFRSSVRSRCCNWRCPATAPAGSDKAAAGLLAIDALTAVGLEPLEVLADRGYTYLAADTWARRPYDRGISQTFDLHTNQRGVHPGRTSAKSATGTSCTWHRIRGLPRSATPPTQPRPPS